MKRMAKVVCVVSALMFLGFALAGPALAESVKVGVVLPLTGSQAKFGEIEKLSFDLALEEINAAGGINGKKLELVMEDDTGRPEVGRSVVEKLITKDKVIMIGGGYSSSVTYAVAGVCQQNQMPFLVNTGSADKITTSGWDYIYRLNPPVSKYADSIETLLAAKVKPKTAAILYENSLFGTEGAKSFEETCKKLEIKVLLKEGYEHGGIDYKPVLTNIKQLNPDILYMVSYIMDASLLMKQAKEMKLTPKMFIGGAAGFTLPEFVQNAGVASEKVISATLWHEVLPFPGAMDYYKKFVAKYNKPTEYHGAEAYAACYVIADVLKRAKSFKNTDVKQALSETDMMTVFGPVKFTTWGEMKNQNIATTYVVQWIDGKLELVWPAAQATKPFVYPVDWLKTWGY
ncbi:MAG: branched-chain amino acid transport system substrate-binding protein [Thermodesulfobacteriota bacterium]|nr:branched-chain amino acid transport system substrate-binding protein [Thermodesulfobacteriota bacterium]